MKRTLVLTTPHIKADDVKYAQRLLTKNGYYDGKVDGEFGPLTAQAAYRAQYWLGYATPKQTFGTVLEKFLLGKTQPAADAKKRIAERKKVAATVSLREKALAKMERFVGLTENPSGSEQRAGDQRLVGGRQRRLVRTYCLESLYRVRVEGILARPQLPVRSDDRRRRSCGAKRSHRDAQP